MSNDTTTNDLAMYDDLLLSTGDADSANFAPPLLQWMHGNKAGKTPGVFYVKAADLPDAPGDAWEPDDRFMEGEEPEMGFKAPRLKLVFIASRSQWYLKDPQNANRKIWLTDYEAGAQKQVEYLVLAEGVAEPMVLSLPKYSKSRPFADILGRYRSTALTQLARQLKRRQLPLFMHWLPITGKTTPDGKTVYEEIESKSDAQLKSWVTTPVLAGDPEPVDRATLERITNEILPMFAGWPSERRGNAAHVDAEFAVDEVPALPAPRNVPQPIGDDEDVPF